MTTLEGNCDVIIAEERIKTNTGGDASLRGFSVQRDGEARLPKGLQTSKVQSSHLAPLCMIID